MGEHEQRPPVGIAHVVLQTDRMEDSAWLLRTIGMRSIFDGPKVSVYEMRGGTHLITMLKDKIVAGDAPFDLMVDDLHEAHKRFTSLGLAPSPIEIRPSIDHDGFHRPRPCRSCHHVLLQSCVGQAHMKRDLVPNKWFQPTVLALRLGPRPNHGVMPSMLTVAAEARWL